MSTSTRKAIGTMNSKNPFLVRRVSSATLDKNAVDG